MGLSTHVLDITRGKPAEGIRISLERMTPGGFVALSSGATDADGRLKTLLTEGAALEAGVHRLTFAVKPYLDTHHGGGFYPEVQIIFEVRAPSEHHHVPLLLSPYGYSTYRGS